MDEETHMVTFSFNNTNRCGTEVMVGSVSSLRSFFKVGLGPDESQCFILQSNNNQIIYQNTISNYNGSSNLITRRDQVFIDFSCVYVQDAVKAFKITSRCVTACETGDDGRCVRCRCPSMIPQRC